MRVFLMIDEKSSSNSSVNNADKLTSEMFPEPPDICFTLNKLYCSLSVVIRLVTSQHLHMKTLSVKLHYDVPQSAKTHSLFMSPTGYQHHSHN